MNSPLQQINDLHSTFCSVTGQQLRIGLGEYSREQAWFRFAQAGFTQDDLETVLRHLQRGIRAGDRRPGALRFSNLIEHLETFEEELEMARAEKRNIPPPMTARERVVEQWRPTVSESSSKQETTKHVSLAAEKALTDLREWKREMFGKL